jgi:hypothetical protein
MKTEKGENIGGGGGKCSGCSKSRGKLRRDTAAEVDTADVKPRCKQSAKIKPEVCGAVACTSDRATR